MSWTPTGRHLIAGTWTSSDATFLSAPAHGAGHDVASGGDPEIDLAVRAAEETFDDFGRTSRHGRASFLEAIGDAIDARGEAITAIGTAETGLPAARLEGERARTVGQLRLFAAHVRDGGYLDRRHDAALPERRPVPRPDLRTMQLPVGPVAVFGASNFPLAFSTAGGDTASALAAGCPVVVKGHPAHPGTGEIVADAILEAIRACGLPPGTFSLVQGDTREVGRALVTHPFVRAVGFTGSFAGGKALFDLCAARPEPIPCFGELGSINPVFVLPAALAARGREIAAGWAGSLVLGAGQFCTNPGVLILQDGPDVDGFVEAAAAALEASAPQTMLTDGIASAYRSAHERAALLAGVMERVASDVEGRSAAPVLHETSGRDWLATPELGDEAFGPYGIVVRAADADEVAVIAASLRGQLTCTLQLDDGDLPLARRLLPTLERKAGRLLANGFPTGVEVSDAMVHGGPYPASTNFGATSVGTLAIRRWLRPVCWQDVPEALLPADLVGR